MAAFSSRFRRRLCLETGRSVALGEADSAPACSMSCNDGRVEPTHSSNPRRHTSDSAAVSTVPFPFVAAREPRTKYKFVAQYRWNSASVRRSAYVPRRAVRNRQPLRSMSPFHEKSKFRSRWTCVNSIAALQTLRLRTSNWARSNTPRRKRRVPHNAEVLSLL